MADVTYRVSYAIATYEGVLEVIADEDADHEHVIAKAKQQLRRRAGPMPLGLYYESWRIL